MLPRISYTKPSITELETRYAADAAQNGWGERCYDYIFKFEAAFKEATKARSAAVAVLASPFYYSNRKQLADLAVKNRLPAMYPRGEFVAGGGLMSIVS